MAKCYAYFAMTEVHITGMQEHRRSYENKENVAVMKIRLTNYTLPSTHHTADSSGRPSTTTALSNTSIAATYSIAGGVQF